MSGSTLTPTRHHGGPRAAADSIPGWTERRWLYLRKGSSPNRTAPMIPDPAARPVVTAEEAFAELGIDRSTGYNAIRNGTFPLPVIRIGRLIRVPTAALRRLLQIDHAEGDGSGGGEG